MMSVSRLIRDYLWSDADGGGCKTPAPCFSSKLPTGLYCPHFECCGDASVAVSHSYFHTRKTVLLLTPVA